MSDHQKMRLALFNDKWAQRETIFSRHAPLPFWAPGLILTDAIRSVYEHFLPVSEYAWDLASVLSDVLPGTFKADAFSAWVPASLRRPPASLPDLWATLPPPVAGRLTWTSDDLWSLACVLAAPLQHGTTAGRYPEQQRALRDWLQHSEKARFAVDYACGTGQGTWELATLLPPGSLVVGITLEPLESWLAGHRNTSHLEWAFRNMGSKYEYPIVDDQVEVAFVAGDFHSLAWRQKTDLIVCNGLIGGPLLNRPDAMRDVWQRFVAELSPGGLLLIGNRFHAGRAADCAAFLALRPDGIREIHADEHSFVFCS
jgi:hypothetical protein